ncbi:MAG: hypothetical protein ACRD94_04725 [Nitrosopumilaceae archaeon]
MNFRIFFLLHLLDLGKKNEYVYDGFGWHHMETDDSLECNMINDTNSIRIKSLKEMEILP